MRWTEQRWEILWAAAKDILLTGTGLALILSQVFSQAPSDVLLVTGLALTVPSVAGHARVLLAGGSNWHEPPSSPSSPPSGPSPSSGSSEVTDHE